MLYAIKEDGRWIKVKRGHREEDDNVLTFVCRSLAVDVLVAVQNCGIHLDAFVSQYEPTGKGEHKRIVE